MRHILLASVMTLPFAAQASELAMPEGSEIVAERSEGMTSQQLSVGAWTGSEVPAIWAEGARTLQAWQGPSAGRTTLELLEPLRAQLETEGFDVLFECRDVECGGFDFRYALDLLPEPEMHVDLGNYRYLSAQRMAEDGTPEYVALVVSESRTREFIHVTRLGPPAPPELEPIVTTTMSDPATEPEPADPIVEALQGQGTAVLEDLSFPAGSSELNDRDAPSLAGLAAILHERPEMRVSLVGHTDTSGTMEANFKLSKARAETVRQILIELYGVAPDQLDAQGVGYLAPLAPNDSEMGRERNRRVEVVVVSAG